MSALQQQHERWSDARARLWAGPKKPKPASVKSPERRPAKPPRPTVAAVGYGAPVDLLWIASPKTIVKLVALRHNLSPDDLSGPRRSSHVVKARHEAIALVYTHCPHLSLPAIGRWFQRDHTTILHALRKAGCYERRSQEYSRHDVSTADGTITLLASPSSCCSMEDRYTKDEAVQ
jgi:hypothetical protein